MIVYFGFAIADSMFNGDCTIKRESLTIDQAREIINKGVKPCINPAHEATIRAMEKRYGIEVQIPEKAAHIFLNPGDQLLIMSARGLPRLDTPREYSDDEIAKASFSFSLYSVHN